MRKTRSLQPDYFEGLYAGDPDPWQFETSPYEQAKYEATVSALGNERSINALEVGCSIGVLTRKLAGCCDRLTAVDVSPRALEAARRRCTGLDQVRFQRAQIPAEAVPGVFDLIVLSEVAYYWDDIDLPRAAAMFDRQHAPNGRVVLVHWLGETDYPKTADQAVGALRALLGDRVVEEASARNLDYRLDLWRWTA